MSIKDDVLRIIIERRGPYAKEIGQEVFGPEGRQQRVKSWRSTGMLGRPLSPPRRIQS
jgi:hypothetical protein